MKVVTPYLPVRIAGGVFGFVFLLPSLALSDLVVGLLPADPPASSHAFGDVGYGIVGAVLVAPAFASQALRHPHAAAPLQQLAVVMVALGAAAVATGESVGLLGAAVISVPLLLVAALHPARREALRLPSRPSRPLLALAAVAGLPALAYAWAAAADGRAGAPPESSYAYIPSTWAAVTAVSLAVVVLGFLAALRPPGWRLTASSVGMAAFLFGIASLINPDVPASPGRWWGAVAVFWSLAWLAASRDTRRR